MSSPAIMTKKGVSKSKAEASISRPPFSLCELTSRSRPSFCESFEGVAKLLHGRNNIVVLVGAGISVSCGIPDFRTKGSGLYSTLDTNELGLSCPEDLFDWDFFQEDPSPFYKFARNLYFPLGEKKKIEPSDSHKLLAMLEKKKMLLRVYSQNIDGLENVAGVSNRKMVYAHGSLQWATCCKCQRKVSSDDIMPAIERGSVPLCRAEVKSKSRNNSTPSPRETFQRSKKRQRPSDDTCGGVFKPGVTFFGETLNDSVRRSLEADRDKVDALVVIGTSLSVAPISRVIEYLPTNIPRILINRTVVHPSTSLWSEEEEEEEHEKEFRENYVFDAYLLGFCDDVTRALAKRLFKKAPSTPKRNLKQKGGKDDCGGKLLAEVLRDDHAERDSKEWSSLTIPPERVLLFPGALASKEDASEMEYCEIAHCDGCSKRIRDVIKKCVVCFDYDLCAKCYPALSRTHHGGTHSFNSEPAAA